MRGHKVDKYIIFSEKHCEKLRKKFGIDLPKSKEYKGLNIPKHYDNSKGSLYKVAKERGWNPYLFDIVKRLERSEKKGEFKQDLEKSKVVIDLWLNEL